MLCEKCSTIRLRRHSESSQVWVYEHYETFELLRSSSKACIICRRIAHWLKRDGNEDEPVIWMAQMIDKDKRLRSSSSLWFLLVKWDQNSVRFNIVDPGLFVVPEKLEMPDESDSHLLSAQNFRLARRWMTHCSSTHPLCSSEELLPLWVIEISPSSNGIAARLVKGQNRRARYATLSYKWGSTVRVSMRSTNKEQLQNRIPIEKLPSTFADAIHVAHSLGYKFLWIDALCITQDVEKELQEQVDAMHQIYKRSDLTLFAATGQNADSGLNVERSALDVQPVQLKVHYDLEADHVDGSITFTKFWPWDYYHGQVFGLPLFERGWVLQEQILSRRALIFTDCQIVWQCLCDDLSEIRPFNRRFPSEPRRYIENASFPSKNELWEARRSIFLGQYETLDTFYNIIRYYSSRELSFEADILRAISGLTSLYAERLGKRFVEGLWLDDSRGLLWTVNSSSEKKPIPGRPSWSWSSRFGNTVHFDFLTGQRPPSNTSLIASASDSCTKLTTQAWTRWATIPISSIVGRIPPPYCTYLLGETKEEWITLSLLRNFESSDDVNKYNAAPRKNRVWIDSLSDHVSPSGAEYRVLLILGIYGEKKCSAIVAVPAGPDYFRRIGVMDMEWRDDYFPFGDMKETDAVPESQRGTEGPVYTTQYLI